MIHNANEPETTDRAMSNPLWLHQYSKEVQRFGTVRPFPLGLPRDTRLFSCQRLNQLLADTQVLYALYKKHHWLMRGAAFYPQHLLLDKCAGEQAKLVEKIAERVRTLGGIAIGDPRHIAEITRIPRAPDGCEGIPAMLSRLLEAHAIILDDARDAAAKVAELGDDGTKALLVGDIICIGERQAGLLVDHLTNTPVGTYPMHSEGTP